MSTKAEPIVVALLGLPETTPGTLFGLQEVVGVAWSQVAGEAGIAACRARPVILSRDGSTFVSPSGARIVVDASLAASPTPDVVVITEFAADVRTDPHGCWPVETAWLRECHRAGAVIASVCTGSVLLAEAGRLDREEARTHWAAATIFREHFPQVLLAPARILCPAGPGHRFV